MEKLPIEESLFLYKNIFDKIIEPVVVFDLKGNINYVNEILIKTGEYSLKEIQSKPIIFLLPDKEKNRIESLIQEVLKEGKTYRDFNTFFQTKNKKEIPVALTLIPLLEEKKIIGGFAILVDIRQLEGLQPRHGLLYGTAPQDVVKITENGLHLLVDLCAGQKTGFYLDQRCNRARVGELSRDRQVLDCFCYTGGFTLNVLAGGAASVFAVETSSDAIALGRQNLALNGLSSEKVNWLEGDVFKVLREFRDRDESFDLIILDPPKFAPTSSLAQQAARGYKDINLLAFKLLRPGGLLVTFSCSGGIDAALFQKIVAGAALDAGVEAQIVERLHQGIDHPVALNFPEGAYLKGLVVRILGG